MNKRKFLITGLIAVFLVTAIAVFFFSKPHDSRPSLIATNLQALTTTNIATSSPANSLSNLQNEYHIDLPNGIMLIDSQGHRTGKDPATGMRYHEIPGTSYGEDCLTKNDCAGELFFSPPAQGEYTLYILGGDKGTFGLDAWDNQGPSQIIRGDIQPGSINVYSLNFTPATVASSSVVSFEEAMSSTVSITSAPPNNLPLPPVP